MEATGIVLSWNRVQNIKPIVERMRQVTWIGRVIVWCNSSEPGHTSRLSIDLEGIAEIVFSPVNLVTFGRYVASMLVETDLIATCDDDCLVKDWDTLRDVHVDSGQLACYLAKSHYNHRRNFEHECPCGRMLYETLVGWGAVFRRDWAWRMHRYVETYGRDEIMIRKADRIFSMSLGERHVQIPVDVQHLPGATDKSALYRLKTHYPMNRLAVRRCCGCT